MRLAKQAEQLVGLKTSPTWRRTEATEVPGGLRRNDVPEDSRGFGDSTGQRTRSRCWPCAGPRRAATVICCSEHRCWRPHPRQLDLPDEPTRVDLRCRAESAERFSLLALGALGLAPGAVPISPLLALFAKCLDPRSDGARLRTKPAMPR